MTECYLRDGFDTFLRQFLEEIKSQNSRLSLLIIDIDHFKKVNDTFGHLVGDQVIRHFSRCLANDFNSTEHVLFRFGGDEFVVLCPRFGTRQILEKVLLFKKHLSEEPFRGEGHVMDLTFSGGTVCYPDDTINGKQLLDYADKALYASKKRGRNRTTDYDHTRKRRRISLLTKVFFCILTAVALMQGVLRYREALMKLAESSWHKVDMAVRAKSAGPSVVSIVLKSGRQIRARAIEERDGFLVATLDVAGHGQMTIKRADVERIERISQEDV